MKQLENGQKHSTPFLLKFRFPLEPFPSSSFRITDILPRILEMTHFICRDLQSESSFVTF